MSVGQNPFVNFDRQRFCVVITCADGLENALLIELHSLGLIGNIERTGRVQVWVDLANCYRVLLISRVASRVLLPIGQYKFKQKTTQVTQHSTDRMGKKVSRQVELVEIDEDVPQALYDFAKRYDWTTVFDVEQSFAIRLATDKRLSVNQQFATLRIKDAIVDSFNAKLGKRPDVSKTPDIHIFASANTQLAELFVDLSAVSLHKRGYRVANTEAPLKENLAAALLYESGWHTSDADTLIDPMCGSGTFVIEALLMKADYPVGLDKCHQFGIHHWQHHDETLWEEVLTNAKANFTQNLAKLIDSSLTIIALDANAQAVQACHKNLYASAVAPLMSHVHIQERPLSALVATLQSLLKTPKNAFVITNPPYGERLGESDFLKPLYQGLGILLKDGLALSGVKKATLAVLASHVEHADVLPIVEPKTLRCHNGALTVYFRHGQVNFETKPTLIERFVKQELHSDPAQEFANRLQKNLAHLKKQAKAQAVSNLRVYDADLPNYNVAIDLYGDKVHVQEYAPPKSIDPQVAKDRFNQVLAVVRETLGVFKEDVFIKTRAKQLGNDQYTKSTHASKKMYLAKEDSAYFYVNFTDYLDTGLFIDHRLMRQRVKQASRGKRVLNLFAYTCTASTHSAIAGARSVTSVDLSANYLNWGKQNFALNGVDLSASDEFGDKYQFIDADVFEWLKQNTQHYDVIFIDPPTFSNSKKFQGTFDVQRDHVALINRAMNRLSTDGVVYFSNNFSRFELDDSIGERYAVQEITEKTIGFDFDPKKPIHRSYEIRHKNRPTHDKPTTVEPSFKAKAKIQPKSEQKTPPERKPKFEARPKTFTSKKSVERTQPVNPKPKVRYEKIDGKLIAIPLDDNASNPPNQTAKKYTVKPKN